MLGEDEKRVGEIRRVGAWKVIVCNNSVSLHIKGDFESTTRALGEKCLHASWNPLLFIGGRCQVRWYDRVNHRSRGTAGPFERAVINETRVKSGCIVKKKRAPLRNLATGELPRKGHKINRLFMLKSCLPTCHG